MFYVIMQWCFLKRLDNQKIRQKCSHFEHFGLEIAMFKKISINIKNFSQSIFVQCDTKKIILSRSKLLIKKVWYVLKVLDIFGLSIFTIKTLPNNTKTYLQSILVQYHAKNTSTVVFPRFYRNYHQITFWWVTGAL